MRGNIYNFILLQLIVLKIFVVQAAEDCQQDIFGCLSCVSQNVMDQQLAEQNQLTCTKCLPDLFLYKFRSTEGYTPPFRNICVQDCKSIDLLMVPDLINMQCVNIGPYCEYNNILETPSGSNNYAPSCKYSYLQLNPNGYKFGSRQKILNYLTSDTTVIDPLTMDATKDQLKGFALEYVNPIHLNNYQGIQALKTDDTVSIVTKCQNKFCGVCEDFDLSQCTECWGRFGDSEKYQICYQRRPTCSSLNQNKDFVDGCYRTADDCFSCQVCDLGYAKQAKGTCFKCTKFDDHCEECSGENTDVDNDISISCKLCNEGFGSQLGMRSCKQCSIGSIKRCKFDNSGVESIQECKDGYILSSDGKKCQKFCKYNEYPYQKKNMQFNFVEQYQCKVCDSSCRTCAMAGAENCLSCNNNNYLKLPEINFRVGTCEPKTQSTVSISMIVMRTGSTVSTGSNRYSDLPMAIAKAYELTSKTIGERVTIYVEPGAHYITQQVMKRYHEFVAEKIEIDLTNPQFHLVIQKLGCTETEAINQYGITDCSPNQPDAVMVTIYNKVGNQFKIQVPLSLKFEYITFDGIDSLLSSEAPSADKLETNCQMADDSVPVCSDLAYQMKPDENQICQFRSYESMFNFVNVDRPIDSENKIQSLEIKNCIFRNIYYELGSIVRLPQNLDNGDLPFDLNIEKVVFKDFSFCGSIVSNDFPLFEGQEGSYLEAFTDGQRNKINDYYVKQASQSIILDCTSINCYKFQFVDNTIDNLNKLKKLNPQQYFSEKVNSQMLQFGLAIHLIGLKNDVLIKGNQFKNTHLNFQGFCTSQEPNFKWTSKEQFSMKNLSPRYVQLITDQTAGFQIHSLIHIENIKKEAKVTISTNVFEGIIMTSSIISISQENDVTPKDTILVQSNQFKQSASYIGANIMTVTKIDKSASGYKQLSTDRCGGGISIEKNSFEQIVGTCQTDTGLIRVQCKSEAYQKTVANAFGDYAFINQQRQIAASYDQKTFDSATLKSFESSQSEKTLFIKNSINNCAFGATQMTRQGTYSNQDQETLTQHELTGSLLTFQDLFIVEMQENTFSNIQHLANEQFQLENSPFVKYLGHAPIITNIKVVSTVIIYNTYDIKLSKNKFTQINAEQLEDSLVMTARNGFFKLSLSFCQISDISKLKRPLFRLHKANSDQQEAELRSVTIDDTTIKNIQIDMESNDLFDMGQKSLILSNTDFKEGQEIKIDSFLMNRLTVSMVAIAQDDLEGKSMPITSLFSIKASSVQMLKTIVNDVDFSKSGKIQSQGIIIVQIKSPNSSSVQPELRIEGGEFKNIKFGDTVTLDEQSSETFHGLISVKTQSVAYTVLLKNIIFDRIKPQFGSTKKKKIASIISIQEWEQTDDVYPIRMNFESCTFLEVLPSVAGTPYQPFQFGMKFTSLTIDDLKVIGLGEVFISSSVDSKSIVQSFYTSSGPQQVNFTNSEIDGKQPKRIAENLGKGIRNEDIVLERVLFDFIGYSSQSQIVLFDKVLLKNIDLMQGSSQISSSKSVGSLIRSYQSNLELNEVNVENILTDSSGTLLFVDEEAKSSEVGGISIKIRKSRFRGCSSMNKGGAIYLSRNPQNKLQLTMEISDTTFESGYAYQSSPVMYIDSNYIDLVISNVVATGNNAQISNSFGEFRNINYKSSLSFTQCKFTESIVLDGDSVLTLYDTPAVFNNVEFHNNRATKVTEGIRIVNSLGNIPYKIDLDTVFMQQDVYNQESYMNLFGSFIHIEFLKSANVGGFELQTTEVHIKDSNFRMGLAKEGGAIYFKRQSPHLRQIALNIENSVFMYNQVDQSGGAIFFDELDLHSIAIKTSSFVGNRARMFGDNIYLRQTKSNTISATDQELSQKMRRKIILTECKFRTPNAQNQVYLEKIENVLINKSSFFEAQDTQAIEGNSLVLMDCFYIEVKESVFVNQRSIIRGGSIYIRQTSSSYFGKQFLETYKFSKNQFSQCESQQGGSIFLKNVRRIEFIDANVFTQSKAMQYVDSAPSVDTMYTDQGSEYFKNFDFFDPTTMSGRGPVIYADCDEARSCLLKFDDNNQLIESQKVIIDVKSSKSIISPSIFTTSSQQININENNLDEVERLYIASFAGTKLVFITSTEKYKSYITQYFPNQIKSDPQNIVPFTIDKESVVKFGEDQKLQDLFSTTDFDQDKDILFGDDTYAPKISVAILNDRDEMQVADSFSKIQLTIKSKSYESNRRRTSQEDLDLLSKIQAFKPLMLTQNQFNEFSIKSTFLEYQSQKGITSIPQIKILTMPGQQVVIEFNGLLQSSQSGEPLEKAFELLIKVKDCEEGYQITSNGKCQYCGGPDFYTFDKSRIFATGDCLKCNKTVFSCQGGPELTALTGYQRIVGDSDIFAQCRKTNGKDICLEDNHCEKGYKGLLCQQCVEGYYKMYDGSCEKCSIEVGNMGEAIFHIALPSAMLFVFLAVIVYFVDRGQEENKLILGYHYIKVILNYVIFLALLSQIFDRVWLSQTSAEREMIGHKFCDWCVMVVRHMYHIPYKSIEAYQCYNQDKENLSSFSMASSMGSINDLKLKSESQALINDAILIFEIVMLGLLMLNLTFSCIYSLCLKSCQQQICTNSVEDGGHALEGSVITEEQAALSKRKNQHKKQALTHDVGVNRELGHAEQRHHDKDYQIINSQSVQRSLQPRLDLNGAVNELQDSLSEMINENNPNIESNVKILHTESPPKVIGRLEEQNNVTQEQGNKSEFEGGSRSAQSQKSRDTSPSQSVIQDENKICSVLNGPQNHVFEQNDGQYLGQISALMSENNQDHTMGIGDQTNEDYRSKFGNSNTGVQNTIDDSKITVIRFDQRLNPSASTSYTSPMKIGMRNQARASTSSLLSDNIKKKHEESIVNRSKIGMQGLQNPNQLRSSEAYQTPVFKQDINQDIGLAISTLQPFRTIDQFTNQSINSPKFNIAQQTIERQGPDIDKVRGVRKQRFIKQNSLVPMDSFRTQQILTGRFTNPEMYMHAKKNIEFNSRSESGRDRMMGLAEQSRNVDPQEVLTINSIEDVMLSQKQMLSTKSHYKFDRGSLALIALAFLLNTQVIECFLITQSCNDIKYFHFQHSRLTPSNKDRLVKVFGRQVNFYDIAVKCDKNEWFQNIDKVITNLSIAYIVVWIFLSMGYLTYKSRRFYIIEVSGILTKLVLVFISKFLLNKQLTVGIMATNFFLTIQLFVHLINRSKQALGKSDKIGELPYINQVDLYMYVAICLSSYTGTVQILFQNSETTTAEDRQQAKYVGIVVLIVINISFQLFWLYRTAKAVFIKLNKTQWLQPYLIILKCNCFKSKEMLQEQQENEMAKTSANAVVLNEMKMLDIMIQQLSQAQKDLKKQTDAGEFDAKSNGSVASKMSHILVKKSFLKNYIKDLQMQNSQPEDEDIERKNEHSQMSMQDDIIINGSVYSRPSQLNTNYDNDRLKSITTDYNINIHQQEVNSQAISPTSINQSLQPKQLDDAINSQYRRSHSKQIYPHSNFRTGSSNPSIIKSLAQQQPAEIAEVDEDGPGQHSLILSAHSQRELIEKKNTSTNVQPKRTSTKELNEHSFYQPNAVILGSSVNIASPQSRQEGDESQQKNDKTKSKALQVIQSFDGPGKKLQNAQQLGLAKLKQQITSQTANLGRDNNFMDNSSYQGQDQINNINSKSMELVPSQQRSKTANNDGEKRKSGRQLRLKSPIALSHQQDLKSDLKEKYKAIHKLNERKKILQSQNTIDEGAPIKLGIQPKEANQVEDSQEIKDQLEQNMNLEMQVPTSSEGNQQSNSIMLQQEPSSNKNSHGRKEGVMNYC